MIFGWLLGTTALWAQPNNQEICQNLGQEIQASFPGPFTEISPAQAESWWPDWSLDPAALGQLALRPPAITYERLPDKRYLRQVSIDVMYQDSLMQSETFSHQDTLGVKEIRLVRKNSPKALRGEDPRPINRFGKPLLTIGASILGVVALFYIRSR